MALLAAMTVGVFALMLMETEPYQPAVSLTAIGAGSRVTSIISDTEVPINSAKWCNIVVHAATAEGIDVVEQCHFVVTLAGDGSDEAELQATALWRAQRAGHQTDRLGDDFNAESIGVCLVGDFSTNPPTAAQFNELMMLVRALQKNLRIGFDRVYLLGDIEPLSRSPGEAFPVRAFEQHLVK